jgi:PAS domain S-box-containing protein
VLRHFLRDQLFDVVPSAVAVIDRDYRLVEANATFEELFGEWRGRHCFEVYKSIKRKCARCHARKTFKDGKIRAHEEVGVDRMGRRAHYVVHMAPVVADDGSVPYVVEMSTNVTRQHQLQTKLQQAHSLNRALIDATSEAVVALDTLGKVKLWNPAAVELFGWTAKQVTGRPPPPGLFPPEFLNGVRHREEPLRLVDFAAASQDGTAVPVAFCGVTLRDKKNFVGSAAFFHDLRELKQLQSDKLDAERLAAVGQTVAGLAHGVKNILTGLEGGLYLMRTGLDKGKEDRIRNGFSMLSRNIGRVTSFVRTLLDFSRGQQPATRLVPPRELAEEAASLFRTAAAQAGVEVVVTAEDLAPASFDPEGIHTCLSNLITNAIDACRMSEKPGRRVELRLYEEPVKIRYGTTAERPMAVVFEVRDDGVGMDYEIMQKVFTNFFTTKGDGGTGLGLLLTRKITHEHGGKVLVESHPGEGTAFRLVFPRHRLPPPLLPEPEAAEENVNA